MSKKVNRKVVPDNGLLAEDGPDRRPVPGRRAALPGCQGLGAVDTGLEASRDGAVVDPQLVDRRSLPRTAVVLVPDRDDGAAADAAAALQPRRLLSGERVVEARGARRLLELEPAGGAARETVLGVRDALAGRPRLNRLPVRVRQLLLEQSPEAAVSHPSLL